MMRNSEDIFEDRRSDILQHCTPAIREDMSSYHIEAELLASSEGKLVLSWTHSF
jgi:hypothetical protein